MNNPATGLPKYMAVVLRGSEPGDTHHIVALGPAPWRILTTICGQHPDENGWSAATEGRSTPCRSCDAMRDRAHEVSIFKEAMLSRRCDADPA